MCDSFLLHPFFSLLPPFLSSSSSSSTDSEKGKDYLSITMSPYQSPTPSVTDDVVLSKVARTHTFKRLRTPSRCRGCDTYVYFHGFECDIVSDAHVHFISPLHVHTFLINIEDIFDCKKFRQKYRHTCTCTLYYYFYFYFKFSFFQCGLSCHRKCLSTLAIRCDTKVQYTCTCETLLCTCTNTRIILKLIIICLCFFSNFL